MSRYDDRIAIGLSVVSIFVAIGIGVLLRPWFERLGIPFLRKGGKPRSVLWADELNTGGANWNWSLCVESLWGWLDTPARWAKQTACALGQFLILLGAMLGMIFAVFAIPMLLVFSTSSEPTTPTVTDVHSAAVKWISSGDTDKDGVWDTDEIQATIFSRKEDLTRRETSALEWLQQNTILVGHKYGVTIAELDRFLAKNSEAKKATNGSTTPVALNGVVEASENR